MSSPANDTVILFLNFAQALDSFLPDLPDEQERRRLSNGEVAIDSKALVNFSYIALKAQFITFDHYLGGSRTHPNCIHSCHKGRYSTKNELEKYVSRNGD